MSVLGRFPLAEHSAANCVVADPNSPATQWNAFLSHLAVAESAAAHQFALIADGLSAEGHPEAARRYHDLACEEREHYERVSQAHRQFIAPSAGFIELYAGALAPQSIPLVERMAVTHFAQETAAVAFLGHLHRHIHEHMNDAEWARELRQLCASLLRDEVKHVHEGKVSIPRFLAGQSESVKAQVRKAVRLHHNFIIRTVRRLLCGTARPFVDGMIASYDRRLKAAARDIL